MGSSYECNDDASMSVLNGCAELDRMSTNPPNFEIWLTTYLVTCDAAVDGNVRDTTTDTRKLLITGTFPVPPH